MKTAIETVAATDTAEVSAEVAETARTADGGRVDAAEDELARQLADRAGAEGLSLTGPGGLLGRVTKRVLDAG